MNTPKIEILAEGDKLGEGPFWDAESQRLLWSDIYNSIIYAYDVATNQKSIYHQGHMTFGLVRHRDGALSRCSRPGDRLPQRSGQVDRSRAGGTAERMGAGANGPRVAAARWRSGS